MNTNKGFITLISVLLVSVVGGVVATSLLLLGLGSSRTSLVIEQSKQAHALADACAEEALQKLRESVYYKGNETKTFTLGTCQIQTISGTGNTSRTLQTIGTVGSIQRKVKITITTVNPTIQISSWQEVADL